MDRHTESNIAVGRKAHDAGPPGGKLNGVYGKDLLIG